LIEAEFLDHLAERLGLMHNKERALQITKKIFHLLGLRLSPEKSKQFVSQLPEPLSSWYVEGWEPHQEKSFFKTLSQFAHDLVQSDRQEAVCNFYGVEEVLVAIRIVLETIALYLSPKAINEMVNLMPSELKQLMEGWISNLNLASGESRPEQRFNSSSFAF
jgi:uncharacterized protein (DUF2267 family)